MRRIFLSLVLSVLFFLYCSDISQYFSSSKKTVVLSTSTKPQDSITGVTFVSGEMIVFYNSSFEADSSFTNFLYQKSNDNGISWSVPEKVLPVDLNIINAYATKLNDESLVLIFNEILNSTEIQDYFYLIRSYDYGKTFTAPRRVEIPGYRQLQITGKAVQVGKSILLLPLQARNLEDSTLCLLLFSDDKGRNWDRIFEITSASDTNHFTNAVLINVADHGHCCLLETKNGYLYSTFSSDTGKTWTVPEGTNIYGSSGSCILSSSGYLVCSYEDKTPQGISMMKSFDLGLTWEGENHLIDRDHMVMSPCFLSLNNNKTLLLYTKKDIGIDKKEMKWHLQGKFITFKKIDTPRALAASLNSRGVQLRWNKVSNASYYIIYRSSTADTTLGLEQRIAKTAVNNYVDRSIKNEGKYYYSVSAVEGYGNLLYGTGNESEFSEPVVIDYTFKK